MIKDIIKEFRRVRASELRANPRNWRRHPKAQREAMEGLLEEIGFAGAVLAYETETGLELIDGHLRTEIAADEEVPVLILDTDEAGAAKILATFDPVSAMAAADAQALGNILADIQTENQAVADMLTKLAEEAGVIPADPGDDNLYTTKIDVPPYEPIGDKPALSDCFDESKTMALIEKINASDLPESEKHFLRLAAYRHVAFHFQNIANFYAHSEAKLQRFFEESALVIVDLDSAIENGWATLCKKLEAICAGDISTEDESDEE